jgi:glycine cleavage system T protein
LLTDFSDQKLEPIVMIEAVQEKTIQLSPLDSLHQDLGARMVVQDGWSVPATYGSVSSEYASVRNGGAGLVDLSHRGRLLVTGSEGVLFLNGLITNDMKTLAPNHWMPAAFPNVQGRLIASVRIIHQNFPDNDEAGGFLIDTEAATHPQVLKTIQRFTLAGDFHVTDLTEQTALMSVQGREAAAIVSSVLGQSVASLERFHVLHASWRDQMATVIRATHTGEDGFDLLSAGDTAADLWGALKGAGANPIGFEALEILRVEAGQPRFGIDMDETNVVTETGLDDAVSFTKGCYIGQEIIARIKYRGHVAKRLSGLRVDGTVERDAKIKSTDDKEIGRVTSVAVSPHLGGTIALGYVKYDYLAPGTEVKVTAGENEMPARVVELPFVHGSW